MHRSAVAADPFRREARAFAGADVPRLGVKRVRPGSPRLGRVVNAEPAGEPRIAAGQDLAPQVALQSRVVADPGAVAPATISKDRAALGELARPLRRASGIDAFEELIGAAFPESSAGNAGEHHPVGRLVGAVGVRGIDVNKTVPRAGIVPAEAEERRAAEARGELPVGPGPRAPVVRRPREPGVARVARPEVEHAIDRNHAARLAASLAVPVLFERRRAEVFGPQLGRVAGHPRQPEAQLLGNERLEAVAVPVGGVERIVIRPRQRPVVAAAGHAEDLRRRRPLDRPDHTARRIRRGRSL